MSSVRVEKLYKRFGHVEAVKGISFEVKEGEFTVLLGPSGCGKTTTLRCIAGLEQPDGGRIYFDDEDVTPPEPGSPKYRLCVPALCPVSASYGVRQHRLSLAGRTVTKTGNQAAGRRGRAASAD